MIPVVAMAGDAVGTATAASLVTTVTDMAGTMLLSLIHISEPTRP